MKKVIIAAIAQNGVIGNSSNENSLPWPKNRRDMHHFKQLTLRHPVIMGRVTAETLDAPLTNRHNIVLSKKGYNREGFSTTTLENVFTLLEDPGYQHRDINYEQVFIIGGQTIYEQTIGCADALEITTIKGQYTGDATFPCHVFFSGDWEMTHETEHRDLFFRRYERT